jgi:Tol biopolymer transport system component
LVLAIAYLAPDSGLEAGDDQILNVAWSPDGAWLAFTLAPGGGMNQQVYLVRPDGAGLRRLTPGGADNNWRGPWTHDGRGLAISSNYRDPVSMDTYLVDTVSGELRPVAESRGIGSLTDVSRDGRRAILWRMASRSDENLVRNWPTA